MNIEFNIGDKKHIFNLEKLELRSNNNDIMKIETHKFDDKKRIFYKFSNMCNMSCTYCFQSKDSKKKDDPKIVFENLQRFENNNIFNEYERVLFGGEPFLKSNLPYIKWLIQNTEHTFIAFTNGAFDIDLRHFIIENKNRIVGLCISIDGTEDVHNNRRLYRNGNGYKTIIDNIKYLSEDGIIITIQANVDDENLENIEGLIIDLEKSLEISKRNIVFSINPVMDCNGITDEPSLLKAGIYLINKYNNIHININSISLQKIQRALFGEGISTNRCRIGKDIILDLSVGKIYTCSQNVDTVIGEFNKEPMIDQAERTKYISLSETKSSECNICLYRFFCYFGCVANLDQIDGVNCKKMVYEGISIIFNNFETFFEIES